MTNTEKATTTSPAGVLAEHHGELDHQLETLVSRARDGDQADLRSEWSAFERGLLRHLEQEEAEILPGFARDDAVGAREILSDHARIRRALLELGLSRDLHLLRAAAVEQFAEQLRAHARREEAVLYAWASRHVTPGGWKSIERNLRDVARPRRGNAWLAGRVM
jgi:hemerythrin-like domain-containing protein